MNSHVCIFTELGDESSTDIRTDARERDCPVKHRHPQNAGNFRLHTEMIHPFFSNQRAMVLSVAHSTSACTATSHPGACAYQPATSGRAYGPKKTRCSAYSTMGFFPHAANKPSRTPPRSITRWNNQNSN